MELIKTLVYLYLGKGLLYFVVVERKQMSHILKHSPGRLAKDVSFVSVMINCLIFGGFKFYIMIIKFVKQGYAVYKVMRALKKFNKKNKQ